MRRKDYLGYMNMLTSEFAAAHNMDVADAKAYLRKFGGFDFITRFFRQANSFPMDETVYAVTVVCRNNGGCVA